MLKTEGLPYSYLHLPAIPKVKKLPTILSREEIWRMLQSLRKNCFVYLNSKNDIPIRGPSYC
ncbi:hypothetical protein [Chryseobacterium manosquense]|uniref:hypothetical protein n=1 Tax=Chryseobacterium manosquense TaxID=2754694 RepID=UPI0021D36E47|nr:hypothetical protein [Chryseobacterium manosquense]